MTTAYNNNPQLVVYRSQVSCLSDKKLKSDAVILFCGDENKTRGMEAKNFFMKGMPVISLFRQVGEVEWFMPDGRVKRISSDFGLDGKLFQLRKKGMASSAIPFSPVVRFPWVRPLSNPFSTDAGQGDETDAEKPCCGREWR
jgi:hypothetical protein